MKAVLALALGACVAAATPGIGKPAMGAVLTSSCRTSTDTVTPVVQKLQKMVTTVDSVRLSSVGLLPTTSNQVSVVTTDSLCALAVTAYNANRYMDSTVTPPTAIYLVKVGSQRYVAFEPANTSGEYLDLLVFSASFAYLGWLAG
jgi:hypothetical protein